MAMSGMLRVGRLFGERPGFSVRSVCKGTVDGAQRKVGRCLSSWRHGFKMMRSKNQWWQISWSRCEVLYSPCT